ncbi:hypothetical protein GLOTRDRAFT_133866 [Gloeophyllum trabeum ATCC 11539]|uniref:RNI-like protein n=1 Tax=Gloeophyllum trabeum (strain ATCC 11539 / FP-39264 / Madison 617) TaxID=670483 RepID=S7PT03_GLOTA|nr:uncharacterized protein GLOTRDRAFT_133866 [Gloeophyllum trabeum ATCC 11539]EPQ50493.1 hypothetical protein GLOTRDRAFT_133866 [Gloeophyllum trabeum ATCC 11539]
MPSDLWKKDFSGRVKFVRDLTVSDIEQCLPIARRVRSLYVDRHNDPLDEGVYSKLLALTPHAAVFPDLVSLSWTDRDPVYLPLFLSSVMQTVTISFGVYNTTSSALNSLTELVKRCPILETVHFLGPSARRIADDPHFLNVLTLLRNVREFTCFVNSIPPEFWLALASWPKLRKLTLVSHVESNRPPILPSVPSPDGSDDVLRPSFECLTHLNLTMYGTIPPAALKQYGLLANLQSLVINLPDDTKATLIEDWLRHVCQYCSPRRLTHISVNPAYRWQQPLPPYEDGYTLEREVLKGLSIFSRLKMLDITIKCSASLDDASLEELAMNWPHLQRLNVGVQSGSIKDLHVTARGVVALLRLCPDLNSLGLVFHAGQIGHGPQSRPGAGICNEKITTIDVGNSPIKYPLDVAEFLSDVLPNVREVKTVYRLPLVWSSAAQMQQKLWKEVERLVPRFAKVRRQERSHCGCSV